MRRLLLATTLLMFAACSRPAQQGADATSAASAALPAPKATTAPAGEYKLDPVHSSLIFRVDHLGFVNFTARFIKWDVALHFDPANPEASSVTASVDPASLTFDNPPPGFQNEVRGPNWLDAPHFREMTFRSTKVERTGADTARVTGDFSFRGQTHPVTLEVKFNNGYPGMALDPNGRVGFSAHGSLNRSEWGLTGGLPPPGSTMGVGDAVSFAIEAELTGPPWTPPAEPQRPPQH